MDSAAVLIDGLSNVKASQQHGVPLQTLRRKVLIARAGGVVEKLGRRTVLTVDEENELCDCCRQNTRLLTYLQTTLIYLLAKFLL